MNAIDRVEQARRTNNKRDAIDRKAGFGAPPDGPPDALLRTAIGAFDAALKIQDWDIVAEGYVMLVDLHKMMHGTVYDPVMYDAKPKKPAS